MSEGRFSQLERDRTEPEEERAAEQAPLPVKRAIERQDALEIDESGPPLTHFCRACEAENRPHRTVCFNCAAPLGREDQEAFDALRRRELAAESERRDRTRSRAAAVAQAREKLEKQREQDLEPRTRGPAASPVAILRDPRTALIVLATCLFATVSATLHLFLSAAFAGVPWSVLAEVAIATAITWLVFTRLHKRA